MSILYDGIGLDVGQNASNKFKTRIGIMMMRERSQPVGGSVEVHAMPERGTRLTVRVLT
jgi:signal transduction histidine kinase